MRELYIDWSLDPNYAHGFLIPPLAAYGIWQKREKLRQLTLQPAFGKGFSLILFSLLLFIVGTAGAEWFISRIAMLLCLWGLVIGFGGLALFRLLWFSLLYLGFMIPLPYVIYYRLTLPLQQVSSFGAFQVMQMLGVPGLREGNIIHFSNFNFEVVEACSGLRSTMVLLALGAVIAYWAPLSPVRRWLVFAAAIPIAILANILRLIIIALLGLFGSVETAMGLMHEGSGIIVFICGLFLLVMWTGVLQWFASRKNIG